jgi:hypothetical protein
MEKETSGLKANCRCQVANARTLIAFFAKKAASCLDDNLAAICQPRSFLIL